MVYVNSKNRYKYLEGERFIQETHETLANPVVISALGEYASSLQAYVSNLYIPTIRHNTVIPSGLPDASSKIPLVVAEPGEVYKVNNQYKRFHPETVRKIGTFIHEIRDVPKNLIRDTFIPEMEDFVVNEDVAQTVSIDISQNASVQWMSNYISTRKKDREFLIPYVTPPILLIRYANNTLIHPGVIGAHEAVHIDQAVTDPLSNAFFNDEQRIQDEAEREKDAYLKEFLVTEALFPKVSANIQHRITGSPAPFIHDALGLSEVSTPDDLIRNFQTIINQS